MPVKKKQTKRKIKVSKPVMKKTDVEKIAKNVVKRVAEKKWFNTEQLGVSNPTLPTNETSNARFSGIGFSTTEDVNDKGEPIMFCGQQVKQMLCLRPWSANSPDADSEREALAMEGKWLQPVSSKSRFRLSRFHSKIDEQSSVTPGNPDYPVKLAENCPVICRIMRVTPKLSSGIKTELAPNEDLFINEYGEACGPETENFDILEILFYKINKRRYTVLEDKNVKLLSPLTLQYQSYRLNNTDALGFTPLVSNTNSNPDKYITMYHQLSKVKGGKCYYENPLAATPPTTATTGHRREYVFMLFSYQGADSIVGNDEAVQVAGPTEINIEAVNYSKFIDV